MKRKLTSPRTWTLMIAGVSLLFLLVVLVLFPRDMSSLKTPLTPRLSKTLIPNSEGMSWDLALAVKLTQQKQYPTARRIFEGLLEKDPSNSTLLNNLAFIAGEQGDSGRAFRYLESAVEKNEHCAECLNNMGSLLYRQGKREEAQKLFERAIKEDNAYADPKLNLAVIAEENSDWPKALDWYRRAEPDIADSDLRRTVSQRAVWMAEVGQPETRNLSSQKNENLDSK